MKRGLSKSGAPVLGRRGAIGVLAGAIGASALADRAHAGSADTGAAFGGVAVIDRLKIQEAVAKYSWAWDSGDLDAYLNCYHPDGALEHPKPDGNPGRFEGREAIRAFLQANVEGRPRNSYALQHVFSSIVMEPDGEDVRLKAYCDVLRHEFHRLYWPHGPSFRMGTWHAVYGRAGDDWLLRLLTVKMWTDTAFVSGTAIQNRPPGLPGL